MIYYDTGADIYCHLKYKKGMHFVGYPMEYAKPYFAHYHGMTRHLLNKKDRNATSLEDVADLIAERLKNEYGFFVEQWNLTDGKIKEAKNDSKNHSLCMAWQ